MQAISRFWLGALAAAALSVTSFAPQAHAQSAAPSAQPQVQPSDISDQKLDATAKALEKVSSVKQEFQEKITKAAPADQQKIASEANDALTKAVTDEGLSVEEYNSIIQVAQNDPQLREKILQRVKSK